MAAGSGEPPRFVLPPVDQIVIGVSPGEMRAASLRQGRPWDLTVARDSRPSLIGNVYRGRVRRVEAGLDAAFVDIGAPEPAFLPFGRGTQPTEGAALLVQVTRDPVDGKGATVSTRIALPGRHLVYTPTRPGIAAGRRLGSAAARQQLQGLVRRLAGAEEGVIIRSVAATADEAVLTAELARLRAAWNAIVSAPPTPVPALLHEDLPPLLRFLRDRVEAPSILIDDAGALAAARRYAAAEAPDLADALARWTGPEPLLDAHGVEAEIEAALGGPADLPSGGRLHVGTTRALTAIDVDSGRQTASGRAADTLLRLDLEAAVEAARLIRFRNLSGLIVIDFTSGGGGGGHDPGERNRHDLVGARLKAAFADDVAEARFVPISPLGLAEIARQRLGPSLPELLGAPCPTCGGGGRIPDPDTVALSALRALLRADATAPAGGQPTLTAAAPVVRRLETTLAPARRQAEERLGRAITLRPDRDAAPDALDVEFVR